MYKARFISSAALTVFIAGIPTFGQDATLRLVASQSSISSGGQVTIEAFIDNLPVALHGYQIGLDITGGSSGQISAADFDGSVDVDTGRSDWVFGEVADAGESIAAAGDRRDPPRLLAVISAPDVGVQPTGERYLGTFVLEASSGTAGDFEIAIASPDAGNGAELVLLAVGFNAPPILAATSSVTISVQFVESNCTDADGDGYGSPGDASCPNGPAPDCNDGNALINPGALEVWYDGVDQDCDGSNDFDQDGDGFACDASSPLNACPGVVGSDCDDTSTVIFPGAAELCDSLDNDCDGATDEDGACSGGIATLHLVASETAIDSGQQVTVEAFIDNLPIELHGYQIGLDITGGTAGQITAAQIGDTVIVDHTRADWAFREISDGDVQILSAGDKRFPPRLFALIMPTEIGTLPQNPRYLGTFVLEASDDAAGDFLIGITPPDVADSGAGTILITVGGGTFPADVDDPSVIPVASDTVSMRVRNLGPTCVDGDSDGYGSPGDASCLNGPAEDCDDGDELIHPGADEIWYDGVDQNCDGLNDYDQDADGFVAEGFDAEAGGSAPGIGDCDDTRATVHPSAVEVCDGLDNDCNDEIDDSPDCAIPAVSEWGLSVTVLLMLTAGTVMLGRPKPSPAC